MCLIFFFYLINFTFQPAASSPSSPPLTPLLPQDVSSIHPSSLLTQKGAGLLCTSGKQGISSCCKIKNLPPYSGWTRQSSLRNRFPRVNQSIRAATATISRTDQDTKLSHIETFFLIMVYLLLH